MYQKIPILNEIKRHLFTLNLWSDIMFIFKFIFFSFGLEPFFLTEFAITLNSGSFRKPSKTEQVIAARLGLLDWREIRFPNHEECSEQLKINHPKSVLCLLFCTQEIFDKYLSLKSTCFVVTGMFLFFMFLIINVLMMYYIKRHRYL